VNIPALIGETSGAKLTFDFKGSAVGICIASGPDAGIIEYRIDGGKFKQLDLYTQWSGSLHLPWYLMLDDQLKNKRHTLELRISPTANSKSKGNACRILYFLVNQ
jgi:sialidase-1